MESTTFRTSTAKFKFPEYGEDTRPLNGRSLCRRSGCRRQGKSVETPTVHLDCLAVICCRYKISSDDALWVYTTWRTPWKLTPSSWLDVGDIMPDFFSADSLGIERMRLLPSELVRMIYEYSSTSAFWRCSAAVGNVARILYSLGQMTS